MIDIKTITNNISREEVGNRSKLSDNDNSMQSVKPKKAHSPMIRQSLEQTPRNVLQDNTNGLSTMKEKLKAIQDNKHMLEKKIQEYEKKLKMIQHKGKRNKDGLDENSITMSAYASKDEQRPDKTERQTDRQASRKTPGPCYRQCLMQNTPQTKFTQLIAGAATSSRVALAGYAFNSNN